MEVVVDALIVKNNKILMVQEGKKEKVGRYQKWNLPGGRIEKGEVNIIKGGKEIFEFINTNSNEGKINSFCINDHYITWYKYDKRETCGKPMFIDLNNKNIEVFFFDDNITKDIFSIVDCRDINTGKTIKDEKIKEKYLIDADTLKAAEDEYYFLDKIKEAEK